MAEILNLRKKEKVPEDTPSSSEVAIRTTPSPVAPTPSKKPEVITWSFIYEAETHRGYFYIALAVLVALAFGVSILFNNYSLGVFLFIAAVIAVIFSRQHNHPITVTISPVGIQVGPRKYPYKEIRSFWVFYTPNGPKELSVEVKKWFMPYVLLPFKKEVSPIDLRAYLIKYTPEKEHHPSLVDVISRRLGV